MPTASRLLLFLPAALALLIMPGPAVLYIVARSMQQGTRAGLISVAGIHTGTLVHIAAAAGGLSALLLRSAVLFTVVKWAGAAYLIGLGIATLRRRDDSSDVELTARTSRRVYWEGFLVQVLNPKTALFFFAFLPQFVDVNRGYVPVQMTVFGLMLLFLGLLTDSLYAVLGGRFGGRLRNSARMRRRQRYATGGTLIGLGAMAGLTGSSH